MEGSVMDKSMEVPYARKWVAHPPNSNLPMAYIMDMELWVVHKELHDRRNKLFHFT